MPIKTINVLIGDQGSGKSTVAKIIDTFKTREFLNVPNNKKKKFIERRGFEKFFTEKTYIKFTSGNYVVVYENDKFKTTTSLAFKNAFRKYKEVLNKISKSFDINEFQKVVDIILDLVGVSFYIPTERNIIPLLEETSMSLLNSKINLPIYILAFGEEYQSAKKYKKYNVDFLKFTLSEDGEFYIGDDKKGYKFSEIASGYQSLIPIIVTTEYMLDADEFHGIIIVEEPESNLFPTTQYELVKYLVNKSAKVKDKLFITTHSPYVLSSLNNLMYAFQVGKKDNNINKVSKIINSKYWVDNSSVSAYMLVNGRGENIMDEELGQIKSEKIDGVSSVINSQYDTMLNIDIK